MCVGIEKAGNVWTPCQPQLGRQTHRTGPVPIARRLRRCPRRERWFRARASGQPLRQGLRSHALIWAHARKAESIVASVLLPRGTGRDASCQAIQGCF
jgi:hypothetical protein